MNETAAELAEGTAPKTGIGIVMGIQIFSAVLGALINCWKLRQEQMASASASDYTSKHYDEVLNTFSDEVLLPVRRQVRIAARKQRHAITPWQEILMAQSVLHKARSQATCSLCLESS